MKVDPHDGVCRSCGGVLEITDADDSLMQVVCTECGDGYEVESDAFGDGGVTYWPHVMAHKLGKGDADE